MRAAAKNTRKPKIQHVPSDIYVMLSQFLDFRSVARLGVVCRTSQAGIIRYKSCQLGSIRLSFEQAKIRDAVAQMPNASPPNIFVLRAPMGFGKTIVGLSMAFANLKDGHRYIFIVPPAAYSTWVTEVGKVFGPSARSILPTSQILFAHSSVPHHYAHMKEAFAAASVEAIPHLWPNVRAVITTACAGLGVSLMQTWATRAIIDEAHNAPKHTWGEVSNIGWIACLSANTTTPDLKHTLWRDNGQRCSHMVAASSMVGVVPVAVPSQVLIAPYDRERCDLGTQHEKKYWYSSNIEEYVNALFMIFSTIPKGRVVLYLPDGDTSDQLVTAAARYAKGWKLTQFKNAVSKIQQFEQEDRSLLIAHHAKTVAINISATHLIIVRPDWVNPIRYSQLVGRVLRPLNNTASVGVFLVVPRGVPSIRARYSEAIRTLATLEMHLEMERMSALEYLKGAAALSACGSSIDTASPIEILAALGIGFADPTLPDKLFAKWLTGPKTLTEPQMRALLNVAPEGLGDADIDALLEDL